MPEVEPRFKEPKAKKAKGRARPEEALAERCEMEGCTWRAHERHHILRRSQGGGDEKSNTMDLCWYCHNVEVHLNPERAYERGWLKRSNA